MVKTYGLTYIALTVTQPRVYVPFELVIALSGLATGLALVVATRGRPHIIRINIDIMEIIVRTIKWSTSVSPRYPFSARAPRTETA